MNTSSKGYLKSLLIFLAIFSFAVPSLWAAEGGGGETGGEQASSRRRSGRMRPAEGISNQATNEESPLHAKAAAPVAEAERVEAAAAAPEPAAAAGANNSYLDILSSLAGGEAVEKEMFIHRCQYVRGVTLKRVLDSFVSSAGSVAESEEADIVVVIDTKSNLDLLRQVAEQVDQPVPQVLVEARIVELTLDSDFEKEASIAYERLPETDRTFVRKVTSSILSPSPTALAEQGSSFSLEPLLKYWGADGSKKRSLDIFIRYLETRGKAKILSSPNLVLRRGSEGNIITGEQIPILTQTVVSGSISTSTVFKSVGIKLKVTPVMITGDTVRIQVAPEVSTVTGYTSASTTGVSNPIIAVRNASTELEVKDRELLSIGGLFKTEERAIRRKVPILGSLPVAGHLFRGVWTQTARTQLVIFLNISILDEGAPGTPRILTRPDQIPAPVQAEMDRMEDSMRQPYANVHHDIELLRSDGAE